MRRGMTVAVLGAAGIAAALLLATGGDDSDAGEARDVGPGPATSEPAAAAAPGRRERRQRRPAAAPARLADHLAVFRRRPTDSDSLPRRVSGSPLLEDGVAHARSARRVDPKPTRPMWLMPGRDRSVCQVSPGSMRCPPMRVIERDGVAPGMSWRPRQPLRIEGIAADGIASVDIRMDGQRRVVARVRANVFLAEYRTRPRGQLVSFRWVRDGRPGRTGMVLPR